MGELINLSDYRQNKEDEFLALLLEELKEAKRESFVTEEDMLFFQLVDNGICPCCGRKNVE